MPRVVQGDAESSRGPGAKSKPFTWQAEPLTKKGNVF